MNLIACTNIGCFSSFGECLRARREARGYSYAKLAHLTGISVSALRRWEASNDYAPAYPYRYAIRLALGLDKTDDHGWWGPD